jgi:SAM-dependent methyltransferase
MDKHAADTYERFLSRKPTYEKIIHGLGYVCLDTSLDGGNPFVLNEYDFQEGFYKGEFTFKNPIDGGEVTSTPETFGRQRVVAALLNLTGENHVNVLDLGAGTLDVARTIPKDRLDQFTLLNSDISGPWSSLGTSSMERGSNAVTDPGEMYNIQYDFNRSGWPFKKESFDYVVSNMALHHVESGLKESILKSMYDSLRNGGKVIITDVFQKDEMGVRLTESGLRGPEECGGYLIPVSDFVLMAATAGFSIDDNASHLLENNRNHQLGNELLNAGLDVHATMAINKAIWFMELSKS